MLNHIIIMGRLTRDPEVRRTGSGLAVASFSVAVERDYQGQDGKRETDFIDCVAWRQTGEFVGKYFDKGSMIVVAGRLQVRGWTDKDGNKRRTAEVVADNVYFGEGRRDREPRTERPAPGSFAPGYGGSRTESTGGLYTPPPVMADDYGMLTDDEQMGLPEGW